MKIALIGDFDASVTAHRAIPLALELAGLEGEWVHTATITDAAAQLENYAGLWCVPASPYAKTEGALAAIRFARRSGRPFLGTCGGFQHALIEYARNACGLGEADHAETNPKARVLLIAPLACSLIEASETLTLAAGSIMRHAYGVEHIVEAYHCNYSLNPALSGALWDGALRAVAQDGSGAVRAVELITHPFFVATLFQPERRALSGELPPLVRALAAAVRQ